MCLLVNMQAGGIKGVRVLLLLLICSIRLVIQSAKAASCDAQGNPCC